MPRISCEREYSKYSDLSDRPVSDSDANDFSNLYRWSDSSLTAYTTRDGTQQNIPESIQLFDIFSEQIAEVVKVNSIVAGHSRSDIRGALEPFEHAAGRYRCPAKCTAESLAEMLSWSVRIRQQSPGENEKDIRWSRGEHAVRSNYRSDRGRRGWSV